MDRRYFQYFFNVFFAFFLFSALANLENEGVRLYYDMAVGRESSPVIAEFTQMPEAIQNTPKALAFYGGSYDDMLFSIKLIQGFFMTDRTFIFPATALMLQEMMKNGQMYDSGNLLQYREMTQSERERLSSVPPRQYEEMALKRVGVIGDRINVFIFKNNIFTRIEKTYNIPEHLYYDNFHGRWVFFEAQGYKGPVAELADFKDTDEIYFLNFSEMGELRDRSIFPVTAQVTGIKDKPQADYLELRIMPPPGSKSSAHSQYFKSYIAAHMQFNGGVAVNSEGKLVGFLSYDSDDLGNKISLTKVTPKLRRAFLTNAFKAGKRNKLVAPGCYGNFD